VYASTEEQPGGVSLESNPGQAGYRVYSLKRQEYVADFCLAARRALTEEDYRLFRYVFLAGADWKLCQRYTGIDRGNFYHEVYRLEEIMGRYMAELKPYPLYPIDEYMGGTVRTSRIEVSVSTASIPARRRKRDRLPMTA
jgi:hypothetical protein